MVLRLNSKELDDPELVSQRILEFVQTNGVTNLTTTFSENYSPLEARNLLDMPTMGQFFRGSFATPSPDELVKGFKSIISSGFSRLNLEGSIDFTEFLPFDIGSEVKKLGARLEGDTTAKGGDASAAITLARSEVGYTEGANNQNKYATEVGVRNNQAWCGTFLVWVFQEAGIEHGGLVSHSTVDMYRKAKEQGVFGSTPKVGAIAFFKYAQGSDNVVNHVGLVTAYSGDSFTYISGNSTGLREGQGDGVTEKTVKVKNAVGFSYPSYPVSSSESGSSGSIGGGTYTPGASSVGRGSASGVGWYLAESLQVLSDEVEAAWPNTTIWSIGDAAHRSRESDHNPNSAGAVTAIDIKGKEKAAAISERLRSLRDSRIKYVIFNSQIFNSETWQWRLYTGSNPHADHVHVSVSSSPGLYDDTSRWNLATSTSSSSGGGNTLL